jgi:hypothetical protein
MMLLDSVADMLDSMGRIDFGTDEEPRENPQDEGLHREDISNPHFTSTERRTGRGISAGTRRADRGFT